jgi:FAD/FMN-containing dehydrogenase
MDVVVQPSVPWMSLNDQIKDSGLFFPVDPGPSVRMHTCFINSNQLPVIPTGQSERMLTNVSGSNWRHGGDELQVIKYFL